MKSSNRGIINILVVFIITAALLVGARFIAVTYCMGNLSLFSFMVIFVPYIFIAAAAFVLGLLLNWNWKKGICIALALAAISFGTGYAISATVDVTEGNDALMNEIYDQLDEEAYKYMLEQGLISEDDELFSEDMGDLSDGDIAYSEMYVGTQESDPASEAINIVISIALAFVSGFAGAKVRAIDEKRKTSMNF